MPYKYNPREAYNSYGQLWWSEAELNSFNESLYWPALKRFFSLPMVKEAVEVNDWDRVFTFWDREDIQDNIVENYIIDVLACFLYLYFPNIDFINELSETNRKKIKGVSKI